MPSQLWRLLAAAVLAGVASPALAGVGDGIRVGGSDGRLHPFVELEGRYDSNVYVNVLPASSAGDFIVHIRPGLTLTIPGELTAVDFTGKLDWAEYLGTSNTATKDLSKLYAEAKLGIGVNRRGTVGLELGDAFQRGESPHALSIGSGVISNYNALDLRIPWRPGGGALSMSVGGNWALETYEPFFTGANCDPAVNALCDAGQLSKLGYSTLTGSADVKWHFLPRTSALLEGSYFKRLPNDKAFGTDGGGFRVATGVTGLVTPHVAATLKGGYGATTGVTPSLGTYLVVAEAEWMPTETSSVKLGYSHDFAVDPQLTYDVHHGGLDGKILLGGRLGLKLRGAIDRLGYTVGQASTIVAVVSPAIEYEATRWLRAEVAYAYTDRHTDNLSNLAAIAQTAPIIDYTKSEAWLKLVFTY
jgi:Putative beta-barrel porin 2